MSHINIPYEDLKVVNKPYFEEFIKCSSDVIESGWYVLGEGVKNFENDFSKGNNSNYCLGVASGLDALILGLSVFDFPEGAKVLVPSNTYIASVLAIVKSGLTPVLIEPDPFTYNITLESVKQAYTKECVAILPVHLYGRLCPMDEIMNFAKEYNLKVIEDCAQSHFASLNNVNAGNFGDIGAFSFYPTKNLGAIGDAGAIVCKNEEIYLKLKALRNYGSEKKYYNKYIGLNSRLDEIQASFLSVKLKDYRNVIDHKRNLASIYFDKLSGLKSIQLPQKAEGNNSVWHIFNVLCEDRDGLKKYLFDQGIGTEVHYPVPPCDQEGYKEMFQSLDFPIAIGIHSKTLSLPISTCHTDKDVRYVCKAILNYFSF